MLHGDIVCLSGHRKWQKSWEQDPRRDDWVKQFGITDFSRGMKLFWRWPVGVPEQFRDDYLIANDGLRKVADHKILGVLRAVERNGVLLQGDIVHRPISLASIDPNAVSTIASIYAGSFFSLSATVGPGANPNNTDMITVTVKSTGNPFAIDAYGAVGGSKTSGALCTVALVSVQRDGTNIASSNYDAAWLVNASSGLPANFSLPTTLSLTDNPPTGTHTYTLHLEVGVSGATSQSASLSFDTAF
jgi:hypothetical protein